MVRTYLTTEERARILALNEGGMAIRDIMTCTGRSRSCISVLIRLARELPAGELPVYRRRPGKRQVIAMRTWKLVRLDLYRNPFLTAFEIKERHPVLLFGVSVRTVAHHIKVTLQMP